MCKIAPPSVNERGTDMARKTKAKTAPVEEVEVEDLEVEEDLEVDNGDDDEIAEFDELDVEETDEEVDEPAPPKTKKKAAAKPKAKAAPKNVAPAFGTNELLEHIQKQTGKSMDGRSLRILLRKLAAEGVIQRTVGEERGRYSFTGVNDPQVKAVVAAIKRGATEKKAEKPAAKKTTTAKKTVRKKATTKKA
jgi:hypothetical protein